MKIVDLLLTENAYFYKAKAALTTSVIKEIFEKILSEKEANDVILRLVRRSGQFSGLHVSCLVFGFNEPPGFVASDSTDLLEHRFGYMLILEHSGYVVVSRRSAPGIKPIFRFIEELDYGLVSGLYVSNKTLFERFHMQNMDFSDTAVCNRTIEALNLQESLPLLSTQRYVLRSMRLSNSAEHMSIAIATSRINRIGPRRELSDLVDWVREVVSRIQSYKPRPSFLDSFPKPIDFEESIDSCKPISILFLLDSLLDELEKGRITGISYMAENKRPIQIEGRSFATALRKFEKYIVLKEISSDSKKRTFRIPNRIDKSLRIYINRKSIVLWGAKLKSIHLKFEDGNYERSLQEYINRRHQFIVAMSPANMLYYGHNLFRDSNLLNNVSRFLDILVPYASLRSITSEKGILTRKSKKFSDSSLFSFIENELAADSDGLVCDDLGDEWADFIAVSNQSITFYHAKHHGESLSASAFHEVVAQAQKNLCRYGSDTSDWQKKSAKWDTLLGGSSARTQIPRLRKGTNIADLIGRIQNSLQSPNSDKVVYFVVDFISKKELSSELRKMQKNSVDGKAQVVQIVWLLSSLVSICAEFNVKVRISCLP